VKRFKVPKGAAITEHLSPQQIEAAGRYHYYVERKRTASKSMRKRLLELQRQALADYMTATLIK
jgi:hypothetical protein